MIAHSRASVCREAGESLSGLPGLCLPNFNSLGSRGVHKHHLCFLYSVFLPERSSWERGYWVSNGSSSSLYILYTFEILWFTLLRIELALIESARVAFWHLDGSEGVGVFGLAFLDKTHGAMLVPSPIEQ